MSTTYTAWDGNDYEWPPPKDWYQAVDNRWWAPDTGPAAMGADASLTDATTQMSQDAEILNPAAARQHNIEQSDLPAWAKPSDIPTNRTTYIPQLTDDDQNGGGSASILLGIGAVVMTLIIVGLVYFIFLNGDNKSGQNSETTPQGTVAVPATSAQGVATSENPPVATAEEPLTTIAIETDAYAAFEEAVANVDGISGVDDRSKIEQQAQGSCNIAGQAEDAAAYQTLRSSLVENGLKNPKAPPELAEESAGQLLDLLVIHFCPSVATQVGLS